MANQARPVGQLRPPSIASYRDAVLTRDIMRWPIQLALLSAALSFVVSSCVAQEVPAPTERVILSRTADVVLEMQAVLRTLAAGRNPLDWHFATEAPKTGPLAEPIVTTSLDLPTDRVWATRHTRTDLCTSYCASRGDGFCRGNADSKIALALPTARQLTLVYSCTGTYSGLASAPPLTDTQAFAHIVDQVARSLDSLIWASLPQDRGAYTWQLVDDVSLVVYPARVGDSEAFGIAVRVRDPAFAPRNPAEALAVALGALDHPGQSGEAPDPSPPPPQASISLAMIGKGLLILAAALSAMAFIRGPDMPRRRLEQLWYALSERSLFECTRLGISRVIRRLGTLVPARRAVAIIGLAAINLGMSFSFSALALEAFARFKPEGFYYPGMGLRHILEIAWTAGDCTPCALVRTTFWSFVGTALLLNGATAVISWKLLRIASVAKSWGALTACAIAQVLVLRLVIGLYAAVPTAVGMLTHGGMDFSSLIERVYAGRSVNVGFDAWAATMTLGTALPSILGVFCSGLLLFAWALPGSAQALLKGLVFRLATDERSVVGTLAAACGILGGLALTIATP